MPSICPAGQPVNTNYTFYSVPTLYPLAGTLFTDKGLFAMLHAHFSDLPLRTRVWLAMAVGLVPLLALTLGTTLILQHSVNTLHAVVEQPFHRLQLTSRLQSQVLKMLALIKDRPPVHRRDWREHLEAEAQRVETGFDDILVDPVLRPPERALLTIALDEWRYALARNNGRLPGWSDLESGGDREQRLRNAAYVLEQIHDIHQLEIADQRANLESVKQRFLKILAAVVAVTLTGAVTGVCGSRARRCCPCANSSAASSMSSTTIWITVCRYSGATSLAGLRQSSIPWRTTCRHNITGWRSCPNMMA